MKLRLNVLLFFVSQVTARHTGHISELHGHLSLTSDRNPLIVLVNTKNQPQSVKKSGEFDELYSANVSTDDTALEDEAEDVAKYLLYNYLLRTGDPQNSEEAIENDKKTALRAALRARCQARVECERKCDKNQGRKEKYCPSNCKAVFDRLNLCESPKKKMCKTDEDECGKWGKTMPPKWFK